MKKRRRERVRNNLFVWENTHKMRESDKFIVRR